MSQLSSSARGLLLALPLTFGASLALAQSSDLQRVEISGQRPAEIARQDVQANCPGIAKTLQEQLAYPLARDGEAGTVRVRFRVDAGGAAEIQSSGGPLANRRFIRRAMHMVDCKAEAQAQLFTFLVSYTPAGHAGSGDTSQRVALLEQ